MDPQPRSGWIAQPGVAQRTHGKPEPGVGLTTAKRLDQMARSRRYNRFAVAKQPLISHFTGGALRDPRLCDPTASRLFHGRHPALRLYPSGSFGMGLAAAPPNRPAGNIPP